MVDRLRAVPAWATLAAIVILSFAVRAWLARGMLGPFIMVDELIYSEMAKSFASDLSFAVRGVPVRGYGAVYPILIAPGYAIFDRIPDVYATVKTINSLVMSLAAVPAYLIARRVVGKWSALLAALLTVAVPSMVYTATVMTENAYYPVFLLAALALVALLERPSTLNHVLFFAALGLAYLTRSQAIVVAAAAVTAPILLAVFQRGGFRATIWAYRWLYATFIGGALLVVAAQTARGMPLSSLLGSYAVIVSDGNYDFGKAAHFVVYHAAELDLYLGSHPRRGRDRAHRPGALARPGAAGAARVDDHPGLLDADRRRHVRIAVRRPDPGAQHLRGGAAVPDPAARLGRAGSPPATGRRECGGRRRRTVDPRDPLRPLRHHLGGLGHADAPAVVGDPAPLARHVADVARLSRRRRLRRGVPLPAAPRCSRAAADRARLLARRGEADLVRAVPLRRQAGGRGRALPGHPRRPAGLDRPRRAGRRGRRRPLDEPQRPLHGEPERVLQSQRRPGLLHRSPNGWWDRRTPGSGRQADRHRASRRWERNTPRLCADGRLRGAGCDPASPTTRRSG